MSKHFFALGESLNNILARASRRWLIRVANWSTSVGRFDVCVDDDWLQLFNVEGWAIYSFPNAADET